MIQLTNNKKGYIKMSAFKNPNFTIEFSLRTQLNYCQMLLMEYKATGNKEKIIETNNRINKIKNEMEKRNFTKLDFCCGTQLMNSVLGLLVIPQQALFANMDDYTNPSEWSKDFPTLTKYVFSNNREVYNNTYFHRRDRNFYPYECDSPRNVLTHMRNAVSHKKIMFYPESSENQEQVTSIVFKDEYKEQYFSLKIDKEDLENVLFEISNYFIKLEKRVFKNFF